MLTRPTSILTVALLLTPFISAAADVPVETEFASFTVPDGWSVVEYRKEKTVRKPVIYLRQKYKTATFSSGLSSMNIFMQDLPAFRGAELPLFEIDAAFDRASNVDAEQTMSDQIIPSMMDLKTATGTLMGHPSREYSFSLETSIPNKRRYVRMSYASFGGKLYGLEMVTLFDQNADLDAWITFVETMKPLKSGTTTSSSSPSKISSASFRSVRGTKSSSSATTSLSRSSESSSSKAMVDRSPRGERMKIRLQKRLRKVTAFTQELANGAF